MHHPDGSNDGEAERLRARVARLEQELAARRAEPGHGGVAERRLQLFLDSVPDFAFIGFDSEGRVTGWSRGAERILGYTPAEAMGLRSSTFFTPEDVARREHIKEVEVAQRDGRAEDERWHLRRDGSRFWGSGVMTALRDEGGELLGYIKVLRDHTERRLAEDRVRDSEERLRLYSENVHDYALVPVDPQGKIVGWNPGAARTFGYTAEEMIGQPVALFFTPEDQERGQSDDDLRRALETGRMEDERWMVRKDGSRFWSHWVTTPMRDAEGELRGFAKVLRDQTDRKHAEELREELREQEQQRLRTQVQSAGEALDRTKEELRALAGSLLGAQEEERRRIARDLHDDLSQRLAVLEMGLARLRQELPGELVELQDEARHLEQLVATLAGEVRRLSHRLHPSILEDLGLRAALQRLGEDFSVGRKTPVAFTADEVPEGVPRDVNAALYRIAQEALRNIARHGGHDPVQMRLAVVADGLRLTVADAGPGFDPAAVRGRGGLGLISMHERARLIGGALHIHSRPGASTTVVVDVPLLQEQP